MPTEQQIIDAWAGNRAYLVDLAFRMLGDIGTAEDVVQEAFTRMSQSDFDRIEDQRGWLIVVTSRLCLDVIRSARWRRELSVGEGLDTDGRRRAREPVDPADRVTLDESVRSALLVVLERLSPAERVAYVLHDIFQIPFDAIADTVGRPEATCRQLARRARLKVQDPDASRRFSVSAAEHREVTERFISACANGSFEQLLAVLDPDVSGGVDIRPGVVVRGATRVARNILAFWGRRPSMVSLSLGDWPCVLAFVEREIAAVLELTVSNDRISQIHVHADPDKLGLLWSQLRPLP